MMIFPNDLLRDLALHLDQQAPRNEFGGGLDGKAWRRMSAR